MADQHRARGPRGGGDGSGAGSGPRPSSGSRDPADPRTDRAREPDDVDAPPTRAAGAATQPDRDPDAARDWERILGGPDRLRNAAPPARTPGGGGRARRRPRDGRPAGPRDLRDQLGLKIGWVRFWVRGAVMGIGIAFAGASLALWSFLSPAAVPIFLVGIILAPVAGLFALLSWALPYPLLQAQATCPACRFQEPVLRLPFRIAHTCRHCRRRGYLERGTFSLLADSPSTPKTRGG